MDKLIDLLSIRIEKDKLVSLLKSNHNYYYEAIEIALSNKQPMSWRAMWIVQNATQKLDNRPFSYISKIINNIPKNIDSLQRESLKLLDKLVLNDEQEGKLFDICMTLWENLQKTPAVRFMAYKFIKKTAIKYPELQSEIEFILEDRYLEGLSPGIKTIISRDKK